jgi:alpha,alpha-trehalose-phosphate synthase [UDP-forming]
LRLLSLRLIVSLIVGITLVSLAFSYFEVLREERGLRSELQRRAEVLGESIGGNIEKSWEGGPSRGLQKLVQRYGNREHLLGVVVYDKQGKQIAITAELAPIVTTAPSDVAKAMANNQDENSFVRIGEQRVNILAVPLHHGDDMVGVLAVVNDANYIHTQSLRTWREAFLRVSIQVVLIVAITILILRWSIAGPIARAAQWMRALRMGRVTSRQEMPDLDLFRPLASEVVTLAQSLTEARSAAENEARLREAGESLWTADRLAVQVQSRLDGGRLFVVSNREPYIHQRDGKEIKVSVPPSGLVTALEPVLNACDGTWIAHGSGDADKEVVDVKDRLRVPPNDPKYTLRRLWLSKEEEEGYYYGFANEGLWPLCHIAHTRPIFRAKDWEHYQNVNRKFAAALVEEMADSRNPVVLVQDYHFALLPRMIKERRPGARVAIFWHIPWPNPEAFGICPWQGELLDGLLGADLIGFHIPMHCHNFLNTVDRVLESRTDREHMTVRRHGHLTTVRPYPVSVAFEGVPHVSAGEDDPDMEEQRAAQRQSLLAEFGVRADCLALGVDRLDYTKGIVERLEAIEQLLEDHPWHRERMTMVQIAAPSRTRIPSYADLRTRVEMTVERINGRYQTAHWKPVVLIERQCGHEEVKRWYQAADLCLVTSLHDGMNLVAKEYVAARDDEDGVLVLSKFTGAAVELRDALIVNPYDTRGVAEAIHSGLEMNRTDRRQRMQRMRRQVMEHNIYLWAASVLGDLRELRLDDGENQEPAQALPVASIEAEIVDQKTA